MWSWEKTMDNSTIVLLHAGGVSPRVVVHKMDNIVRVTF